MRQRALGKTGIAVSELGFGGLFTSALGPGFDESRRAVRRAVEKGPLPADVLARLDAIAGIGKEAAAAAAAKAVGVSTARGTPQKACPDTNLF